MDFHSHAVADGEFVDARSLRLVVAALSAADSGVAEAVAGLEHLVGRTVGWTIGATAPALLPVGLLAAGRTVLLAPDLPQRAAPALERWLTAHPEEVEHLVAGGGGLLEGLWDGLTPTVPGGPWGLPLDTGDAAAAAALLSRLYPDGRVRATPLPGVRVEASSRAPGDVADLVEAAKSGRIDAQENPLTNTFNFGTNHYHRHITLSGHFYGMVLVLANNAQFESWPQAVRDAVTEGMVVATAAQRDLAQAEDADILEKVDPAENEIVHLTDTERAAFKAAVGPLLAEQRKILGEDLFAHVE